MSTTDADRRIRLPYGAASSLALELAAGAGFWKGAPHGAAPVDDPVAAAAAALADPLEFPPLASAAAPGDRAVIALEADVPQAAAIVAAIAHTLLEGETACESVRVVCETPSGEEAASALADPLGLISPKLRPRVLLETHDGAQRPTLSYLAASRDARPIYFNRRLLDADLVIPVGVARPSGAWTSRGLFPAFSDQETQERFQEATDGGGAAQKRLAKEADEAIWLLGAQFLMLAAPGPGDSLLQVHAGERHAVIAQATAQADAVWRYEPSAAANLVVAAIDGGPMQQSWLSFGRALEGAMAAAAPGGAIVLCTELACPPGAALSALAHPAGRDAAARVLRRQKSPDAWPAKLLHEALSQFQIYLLSRLDQETVEELGMAHVASAAEVARLARSARSCTVLESAQHAVVSPPTLAR